MFKSRIVLLAIFVFSLSIVSSAQTPDEKAIELREQEISLLEEVLEDAANLKLPENRALVYAQVGNKIWDIDEKYARELFQNSINELISAQKEAEATKSKTRNLQNLIYGQNPRSPILHWISVRDAEMALEFLVKSRPSKIEQIIAQNSKNSSKYGNRYSNETRYYQNELRMEQRFISLASQQNPKRKIELVKASIKKGVNYETFNMIYQIHQKDPASAKTLIDETISKLLSMKIDRNNQNLNTIQNFIDRFGIQPQARNNKQPFIPDSDLRALVDKLSNAWLKPRFRSFNTNSNSFKAVERMFPSRASNFKQRVAKYKTQTQHRNPEYKEYNELIKNNLPPEEMIRQAKNFPTYRYSIIETAIRKISQEGDINQLKQILTNEFPESERNRRLIQYYSNKATQESSKGNFDEAYYLINEIPVENQKFFPLIQLANSIYSKNPKENKQQALPMLRQANTLLAEQPDTQQEMNKYINLASSYSNIEPNEAFRLIETIIEPINKYAKAYAVVSQFRNEGRTRNGEFLISMGVDATGHFNIGHVLQNLKNKDFTKTVQLINRFEQMENRISFKMQIVTNLSNSKIANLPINTSRRLILH